MGKQNRLSSGMYFNVSAKQRHEIESSPRVSFLRTSSSYDLRHGYAGKIWHSVRHSPSSWVKSEYGRSKDQTITLVPLSLCTPVNGKESLHTSY